LAGDGRHGSIMVDAPSANARPKQALKLAEVAAVGGIGILLALGLGVSGLLPIVSGHALER